MKKYLIILILCPVLVLTAIASLNFYIDPLLLYPHDQIKPLDIHRKLVNYARAHKSAQLEYLQPDLVVLGSSRAFDGIDPNHPYLNSRYSQSYNAALYNGTVHEMFAMFHQAQCQGNLKTVIIALDFFVFNDQRPQFQTGGGSNFLYKDSCHSTKAQLVKSLFNINNLQFNKVFNDRKLPAKIDIEKNGSMADQSLLLERKNPRLFSLKSEMNYVTMDGFYKNYVFSETSWQVFTELLNQAKQQQIEVKIFISPSHVRRWEVLDLAVGQQKFEQFKQRLTELVSSLRDSRIEVWDFAVYHRFTTEPLSDTQMNWHWDTSHYKKSIGAEVINRMFNQAEQAADFGIKLTPDNLTLHLSTQQQLRALWVQKHQKEVSQINTAITSALAKHP